MPTDPQAMEALPAREPVRPRRGAYYARFDGRLPVGCLDRTRAHFAKRRARCRRRWSRRP